MLERKSQRLKKSLMKRRKPLPRIKKKRKK